MTDFNFEEEIKDEQKLNDYLEAYVILVKTLYINGALTDEDLKDSKKISEKIIELRGQAKYNVVTDFREGVLKIARKIKRQKNYMFSKVFYQMYFEHSINSIILYRCQENSISKESTEQIIRRVGWDGKFTWIIEILGLPAIEKEHLKIITIVNEARNFILHYKFKSTELNDKQTYDPLKESQEIEKIEKTISYLRKYEKIIRRKEIEKIKAFKKVFFHTRQKNPD